MPTIAVVTGATGYVAGHLIRELLAKGITVRGTVRDPADTAKSAHLTSLPGAAELLTLHKADLLDDASVFTPICQGADVVFHTASPFFTMDKASKAGEAFFSEPAIKGTVNVLAAADAAKVPFVVVTSSTATIHSASKPSTHVYSEEDWADADEQRAKGLWYPLSKTLAERAAWDFMKAAPRSFQLATMQPCMIAGPMLQPGLNASTELVRSFVDGSKPTPPAGSMSWVDVRDVAHAHVAAWERRSTGRHLLIGAPSVSYVDLYALLKGEGGPPPAPADGVGFGYNASKAVSGLGIHFRSLSVMIADTLGSLKEQKHLAA